MRPTNGGVSEQLEFSGPMTTENPSANHRCGNLSTWWAGQGHKLEASLGYLLKLVSA